MKEVIFIKLGGSIITDKSGEKQPNLEILSQLVDELSEVYSEDRLIVLGHGAGSYGHPQAKKFQTIEGDIEGEVSQKGMAEVRQAVTELNGVVLGELVGKGLPTVTLSPVSFILSNKKSLEGSFLDPYFLMLEHNLMPVIHGDVIMDQEIGWTIFSGEKILNFLATETKERGFYVSRIVEVGNTDGVYDQNGETISEINQKNFTEVEEMLKGSEHADVTGGMVHKVKEARDLALQGIPTLLISAKIGNLKKAILGEEVLGTWIK